MPGGMGKHTFRSKWEVEWGKELWKRTLGLRATFVM